MPDDSKTAERCPCGQEDVCDPTCHSHPDHPDNRSTQTADLRCPICNLSWTWFPPAHVHGATYVRCVECKSVFGEDGEEINDD